MLMLVALEQAGGLRTLIPPIVRGQVHWVQLLGDQVGKNTLDPTKNGG